MTLGQVKLKARLAMLVYIPFKAGLKFLAVMGIIFNKRDFAITYDIVSLSWTYKYYLQRQLCPTIVGVFINEVVARSNRGELMIDSMRDEMSKHKDTFDYLYPILQSRDAKRILLVIYQAGDISSEEYKALSNPNHDIYKSMESKQNILKDAIDVSALELDIRFGI